jgi:hypothetical protein
VQLVRIELNPQNLAVIGAYYYDQVLLLNGWEAGTRIAPGFLGGFLASVSITRRCKPTVYLDFRRRDSGQTPGQGGLADLRLALSVSDTPLVGVV